MPLLQSAPATLHPYFGYRSPGGIRISARILRQRRPQFGGEGTFRALTTLLSQYASHEVAGHPVTLAVSTADGRVHRFDTVTDKEGFALFDVTLPDPRHQPATTVWETVQFHYDNDDGAQCAEGHLLVPGSDSKLAIISDIDDTIIETGITGGIGAILRHWRRLLATMPGQRLAVPGADSFYRQLGGGPFDPGDPEPASLGERMQATPRPFFYVSSSPWNLSAYLVAFKQVKGLPLGPMMLRDWGLNRETLGKGSHGAHKIEAIRQIIAAFPDRHFALVGDDTQGDFDAFAQVAAIAPDRIAAIFIRRAASAPLDEAELAARQQIEKLGIPLWVGDSYDVGQDFLREAGLAGEAEPRQLVVAVEEEAQARE